MKKKITIFMFVVILLIGGYVIYQIYQEDSIKNHETQKETKLQSIENTKPIKEELEYKGLIPEEYKGYQVSAKLEIEKLDVTTYVLEEYTKPSMEVATAKYFGPKPNEEGNYCIAGHNYIRKNMFSELGKLEVGDTFTLTDNWHGTVNYKIYDKYKANPNETQALSQKTGGETEVTLITCTNYSDQRIIVKARKMAFKGI